MLHKKEKRTVKENILTKNVGDYLIVTKCEGKLDRVIVVTLCKISMLVDDEEDLRYLKRNTVL